MGLLRTATDTLKTPSSGVSPAARVVINAAKTRHERREGWIKTGTNAATVTIYSYVCDEFQVTSTDQNGDEVWMWVNALKRYESGDPTTPLGRSVLSERFQLTRILPEHLGNQEWLSPAQGCPRSSTAPPGKKMPRSAS